MPHFLNKIWQTCRAKWLGIRVFWKCLQLLFQLLRDEWLESQERYDGDTEMMYCHFDNRLAFWQENSLALQQWLEKKARKVLKIKGRFRKF